MVAPASNRIVKQAGDVKPGGGMGGGGWMIGEAGSKRMAWRGAKV